MSSPSNQATRMTHSKFKTLEGSNKAHGFSIAKDHTPPEPKVNYKPPPPSNQGKSNQASNSTKGADSPWSKEHKVSTIELRHPHKTSICHSNNKTSQCTYYLGTIFTRARIIINDHKHNPLAIHNKKNVDQYTNSSQNRGRNQPTKNHIYIRDKHYDGTSMGRNQGIVTQSGEQIKPHKNNFTFQVSIKRECLRKLTE
jgi:hypothetical protein